MVPCSDTFGNVMGVVDSCRRSGGVNVSSDQRCGVVYHGVVYLSSQFIREIIGKLVSCRVTKHIFTKPILQLFFEGITGGGVVNTFLEATFNDRLDAIEVWPRKFATIVLP